MDKSELLKRLSDIEWDDFEVKEARIELPKNIWETVSAFSNMSGGWVVLGISQKGKKFEITGVENAEKLEQDFTTVLRSKSKFNVQINPLSKKYKINDKTVLSFFIPSSNQKPVYFNSLANTFIRTGSGDQRADDSEINAMFRDQLFGVMSARPAMKTTHEDINRTTLVRYRDYMSRFNPSLPYNTMPEKEFLERMQIVEGEHLTYGGLLFMGKNLAINQSIPDFRVDLLEVPGKSYAEAEPRYTFRLEEQENLWEYYFAIIERLKRQVDMPFKMNDMGIAIEDSPPFEALREALVNMLMHADYFSVAKPRVRIFTDRIEFENPGNFPLPISELLKKDISLPRNPVIAKLFRNVKLAENAGYGFDKMLKWEKETHKKVVFDNTFAFSLVTFNYPKMDKNENVNVTDVTDNVTDVTDNVTDNVTDVTDNVTDNVTDVTESRKNQIIKMIQENNRISLAQLAKKMSVTKMTIIRDMDAMKEKGIIRREGDTKSGQWKII